MAVTQRLEFRQSQSLVMTPQLQQAIKLLQLSNLELTAYVEQELERNPLLERDEPEAGEPGEGEPGTGEPGTGTEADSDTATLDGVAVANGTTSETAPSEQVTSDQATSDQAASDLEGSAPDTLDLTGSDLIPDPTDAPLDADDRDFYDGEAGEPWSQHSASSGNGSADTADDDLGIEQRVSEVPSLRAHLLDQLQLDLPDPADRMIGLHLIDMLDESGYLVGDLETLTSTLGCEAGRVEATLKRMQGFDPTGIFARDLRECLALQLAERDRLDPAMAALLDNLDLLASRDLKTLKRLCGIDDEDLGEMIAEIRALDPKPALAFDTLVAEAIVPDILMRPRRDGGWSLELNSETLPRLIVNNQYYTRVAKQAHKKSDRAYITEHLQSANWLVKSLDQRANTILKVGSEIVRQQDAFFRKGIEHLRPLTLRDIAEAIEMHESTVSRVTSNKFIATPRGNYELKYFFTSAIAGTAGGSHSAEAVRHRIKALIDAESPDKILSDDRLVDLLRGDGIDIARRTIAKYREALRIPSSVHRRRQKKAALP